MKSYSNYLKKLKNNFQKNPKKILKSEREVSDFHNSMKHVCRETGDHLEITNLFADFFQNTYPKPLFNYYGDYS